MRRYIIIVALLLMASSGDPGIFIVVREQGAKVSNISPIDTIACIGELSTCSVHDGVLTQASTALNVDISPKSVTTPFVDAGILQGHLNSIGNFTSCALDGGTPSQCSTVVSSGVHCIASIDGTTRLSALAGIACHVTGTVIQCTADNGHTETVDIWCDK